MNSNQRRKLKRRFAHVVCIQCADNMPYYWHDQKVLEAKRWCRRTFFDNWATESDYYSTTFKFHDEKDALMFALRWS
jgi:hypothetical protein